MADVTVVSAKIPAGLAARIEGLAAGRLVSVSALVRKALERELSMATAEGEEAGPVELAARLEITGWGLQASETRVAAALNLARRLDTDPTNGATHARELRMLLDDLAGVIRGEVKPLDVFRARLILKAAGYGITDPDGNVLNRSGSPRRLP